MQRLNGFEFDLNHPNLRPQRGLNLNSKYSNKLLLSVIPHDGLTSHDGDTDLLIRRVNRGLGRRVVLITRAKAAIIKLLN